MADGARSASTPLREVCSAFGLGELLDQAPLGAGHIHATYALRVRGSGGASREVVAQRLNERVFPDLALVMGNLERVAAHPGSRDWVAPLVRTPDGRSLARDADGSAWRVFERIAGAVSHDAVDDALAREAGRAFAAFSFGLADLPPPPLVEPLPGFHDTEARRTAFEDAAASDPVGRASTFTAELRALREAAPLARRLIGQELPLRVTHNDTKVNNVLFDERTRVARTVVDLDTVAPGLIAWDFGDLVRSAGNAAPEDAADPSIVRLLPSRFVALAEGWFAGAAGRMTPEECHSLVPGAQVMTYELALRFATDWLQGDRYFRVSDAEHNLRRVRVQLSLLRSMQEQQGTMVGLVEQLMAG